MPPPSRSSGISRTGVRPATKAGCRLSTTSRGYWSNDVAEIDPRKLTPSQAVRLINSTNVGKVIDTRKLYDHRQAGGYRVGDGSTVDLYRYGAWLAGNRKPKQKQGASAAYEAHKDRQARRQAELSRSGRNIGELPEIANPDRRAETTSSFRSFCEEYFPATFSLAWSEDHLRVIERIDQAVTRGGLFAMAMPRGSGKSSIAEIACLWASMTGKRNYVCLIGSNEAHAATMLESLKVELETNDLLEEDYPEVCYPIRALEGMSQRCAGQLYEGERTYIGWTAKEIVLPTILGSSASAAVIKVAGLTGQIRGMKYKRPDGATVRPSLVVLDDPQTDESARSVSQCTNREQILAGAVLGLAGPGKKISGIMPCTVIRPDDMADRILDREKHPEWNGERTKMVYDFPTNEKLWEQYAELRAESLRNGGRGEQATDFYEQNRDAMDEGSRVAWPQRYNDDELSAIQHAMNLKIRDERAFFAEYQNDPMPEVETGAALGADDVASQLNGYEQGIVPGGATTLTGFIDVSEKVLWWTVVGWSDDFTGWVTDYGGWPDQGREYFTLRDVQRTLKRENPTAGREGSIRSGLEGLTNFLAGKVWKVDGGGEMSLDRLLIDANWGETTELVKEFCRTTVHRSVVTPSHGRYVGAAGRSFAEYTKSRGDRVGWNWRVPFKTGAANVRHCLFDTNYWKSFVHARLGVSIGDPGSLSLYGRRQQRHAMFSEQVCAEYPVRVESRNRTVDEWKIKVGNTDNHFLDCLVGSAVGASMQGCRIDAMGEGYTKPQRKRVRLSDIKKDRR